jgi:hypothetical protein
LRFAGQSLKQFLTAYHISAPRFKSEDPQAFFIAKIFFSPFQIGLKIPIELNNIIELKNEDRWIQMTFPGIQIMPSVKSERGLRTIRIFDRLLHSTRVLDCFRCFEMDPPCLAGPRIDSWMIHGGEFECASVSTAKHEDLLRRLDNHGIANLTI